MVFLPCVDAHAITIALDPGHGGIGSSGSGAIYPPFVEKELNYDVAIRVREELEEAGITTYITRDADTSLSLEDRAVYAASVGADILVSLHFNSSGPHDKYGSEVWTSFCSPYFDTGVSLGSSVLRQLSQLGFASKGVKTRLGNSGDYYGVIRNGVKLGIPTVIVESCFIDSAIDRAILDGVGTEGIAHAVASGIIEYVETVDGIDRSQVSKIHRIDESGDNAPASGSMSSEEFGSLFKNDGELLKRNTPSAAHSVDESRIYEYRMSRWDMADP